MFLTSVLNFQLGCLLTFTLLIASLQGTAQSGSEKLFNEAKELENAREYEISNAKYLEVAPILLAEKKYDLYYQTQIGIGYNFNDLKQFKKAESFLLEAIHQYEVEYKDTFLIEYPRLMHCLGNVYLDIQNYKAALTYNRKALSEYQNVKSEKTRKKYTAFMYNNIGSVYKSKREMDSSLHYLNLALPLKKEVLGPTAASTQRTLRSISGIYQDWGQLDKAIGIQKTALKAALEEKDKDAEAQAYNGLSQMYQRKKDFETSKNYISKSYEIYNDLGDKYEIDIAYSSHQMGNVLEAEKAHEESIQWYMRAKNLFNKIHHGRLTYQEGLSTMSLGKAYNFMAEELEKSSPQFNAKSPEVQALRQKALEYYEENESIFKAAISDDHARYIELWLSKGVCLLEHQDTIGAHRLFTKAYQRAYKKAPEKSYDRSLSCLNLARTTTNIDSALALYQKGLWELSNGWESNSYDDNPSADQVFYENWSIQIMLNKAIRLNEMYESTNDQVFLKNGISTMVAADELLKESRETFLTTSAKLFLGQMAHDIYAQGVNLCHTLENQESQAFDFIEKNKGLVLLEALHQGKKIQDLMVPDSISSELKRLDERIGELKTQQNQLKESQELSKIGAIIYDLEQERDALKTYIYDKYPILNRITDEGLVITLDEVKNALNEGEQAYEYLETSTALFILRIAKEESKLYKTPFDEYRLDLDSLLNIINDIDIAKNQSNSKKVWDRYRRLAHKLYRKLLPDLKNNNLLIIPDGKLNYLPFELLLTENSSIENINYSRLPYLLKSSIIKYGFSSSLHFADVDIRNSNQDFLLAMAPTYPSSPNGLMASRAGFSALKFNKNEASNISSIMKGNRLIGPEATKDNFISNADNYQVLHLAMHAYTHDKDPMLSGMIFSMPEDTVDNILHAYELYTMDIPSELVVLSACNTGLGQHKVGEGVMSLGRAFKQAGTQNIVMSLWQADDKTTSEIMTSFYTKMKDGVPKAKALRDAKLDYLESGENVFPHFWGSFVLLGDDQPLDHGINMHWMWLFGLVAAIVFGFWAMQKLLVK